MLDPRDFIDPDEGPRPKPFFIHTPEVCQNCLRPCERVTWVPGFNYFGCDDCCEEARIMIFAEDNCPALHRAILRAKLVSEVRRAFHWHKETCPKCRNERVQGKPAQSEGAKSGKRRAA